MSVWIEPTSKLFISVDIQNSTKLKAGYNETNEKYFHSHWYQRILHFYYKFNYCMQTEIAATKKRLQNTRMATEMLSVPNLKIWKINGDEILYQATVTNEYEVCHLVNCLRRAITKYQQTDEEQETNTQHNLIKGSVWFAVFPVANEMVYLRANFSDQTSEINVVTDYLTLDQYNLSEEHKQTGGIRVDYIGPSIDTGFRLAKFATDRKLTLSIEIVMFVASAMYDFHNESNSYDNDNFRLTFEGRVPIRGFPGGSHYPLFWLDNHAGENLGNYETLLDDLENREVIAPHRALKFCQSYLQKNANKVLQPFLSNSRKYGTLGNHYLKILASYRKRYSHEIKRSQRMNNSKITANGNQKLKSKAITVVDNQSLNAEALNKVTKFIDYLNKDNTTGNKNVPLDKTG